jgi:hypothetical protein
MPEDKEKRQKVRTAALKKMLGPSMDRKKGLSEKIDKETTKVDRQGNVIN